MQELRSLKIDLFLHQQALRPPHHQARELAQAIRDALSVPGRPGIRVIAKQFGVSPMTVQTVGKAA